MLFRSMATLPHSANAHRRALMPKMLPAWAERWLRYYRRLERIRGTYPEEQREVARAADHGRLFFKSFEGLSPEIRDEMCSQIVARAEVVAADRLQVLQRFETLSESLRFLIATVEENWAPRSRGRPRNKLASQVMLDIAAFYRYVTESEPKRLVNRITGLEYGPFYDFGAAIWSVVLKPSDGSFTTALRNWDTVKDTAHSSLIEALNFYHPEFRLFDEP